MRNKLIVVNCANVKAALGKLEMRNEGMKNLPCGSDFSLGLLPILEELEASGQLKWSLLAKRLNERGIVTSAGKRWGPVTVNRLLGTLGEVIRVSTWEDPP